MYSQCLEETVEYKSYTNRNVGTSEDVRLEHSMPKKKNFGDYMTMLENAEISEMFGSPIRTIMS